MSTKSSSSTVSVTAIVYSAKGLKPKKKDKHKFCVIFGVGANKYRTDVVEDLFDNPVFSTECDIDVDDVTLPLTFLVTEKNDRNILGQVSVPLSELTSFRTNHPLHRPLQPHKKCPNAVGELVFEAWISAGHIPASQHVAMTTPMTSHDVGEDGDDVHKLSALPAGLRKLKDKLTAHHSPTLHRKLSDKGHRRNNSDGGSTVPMSASLQDLLTLRDTTTTTTTASSNTTTPRDSDPTSPRRRSVLVTTTTDLQSLTTVDFNKPEVTGVSPKEGSSEGGTRLTIRGSNLGRNKDDVVGLYVCGSNVLSTLEYLSASKLVCTTKPHKPCCGTVSVETQTGGRGASLVQFTFTDVVAMTTASSAAAVVSRAVPVSAAFSENYSDSTSESSSLSRSSSRGDADIKRQPSVRSDSGAGIMSSSVKPAVKARSMFDLSLPQVLSPSSSSTKPHHYQQQQSGSGQPLSSSSQLLNSDLSSSRPEVTGVSPREGPTNSQTRLVVRGSNLGLSADDIVSLHVAALDCTATLDYESSTRLTCLVGPITAPASGEVIVETRSGGLGISMVQFRFVDAGADDDQQFAAVPYDVGDSRSSSTSAAAAEVVHTSSTVNLSASAVPSRLMPRAGPLAAAVRGGQTPPVVEIQPMMSSQRVTSTTHGKAPAPPPPTDHPHSAAGISASESQLNRNPGQEIWLNEQITEMSSNLAATEELVKRLQQENKLLRDENERMRQYMECLVSKAIATCPQILCVDTSKFF